MGKITQLDSAWKDWITNNLARGCTSQSLVNVMVGKNFDPAFANAMVLQFSEFPVQAKSEAPALASSLEKYINNQPIFPTSGGLIHTDDRVVKVVARVAKPVVAVLDNLLSDEECDLLVELSSSKLKRSSVVNAQTGARDIIDARSSHGTYFTTNENDFIAKLDRRTAQVMHWPVKNGEGMQTLNYQVGGEYKPHFDYFPEDKAGSQVHLKEGGQRVSTLVMYLNTVESGGETIFPKLGLTVIPNKGSAVYFEYCNNQGQVDPLTLHGGNPVIKGEKWIATKWMRQRQFR